MPIPQTTRAVRAAALAPALAVAFVATACDTDSITDINVNPNNPTTAPSGPVFTTAVRIAATRWLGNGYSLRATELVAQHLSEVQYPESDQYIRLQANSTSDFFDDAYAEELQDLTQVARAGQATNDPGIYAPALALRAWVFGYLTDTYGDIPYSQALQGDSSTSVTSPAYDAQRDVYTGLFTTLAKVSTDLAAAPAGGRALGSADPIYAGNFAAWQRFANSLRARQAMRLANVDATTARTQVAAALAAPGGLIASNAQNARVAWPGGVNANSNSWSVNFQSRDDHRISNTFMAVLRDRQDPRTAVWAQVANRDTSAGPIVKYCAGATPCYVGLQNALLHSQASPFVVYTSRPGIIFYPTTTTYGVRGGAGPTTPSYLMTFAEVSFLKAEAAERQWIAGSAATFYQDGIRASMQQWGVSDAAIATYLAQPGIVYTPGTAGLRQIAVQKWIALFTDGGQAWAEFRRTCQPATIKPGPSANIAQIPRRFAYSVTEVLTNSDNLKAALARQGGGDDLVSRMYWDKSPTAAPTYEAGCGVR